MTDPECIKRYIPDIVAHIGMVLHGPLHIERFGVEGKHPGPGYSAMQFIETSSITIHLDEIERRAFIDIFSCKDFDAEEAAHYTQAFFGAGGMKHTILDR